MDSLQKHLTRPTKTKKTCSSSDMTSKILKMLSRFFRYSALDDGSMTNVGSVVDESERRMQILDPAVGGLKQWDIWNVNVDVMSLLHIET